MDCIVHGVAKSQTWLSDFNFTIYIESFPGVSVVKNPQAIQETLVQSLGWEYPLEKEMATHLSVLAWEISWTEVPGGLQSKGSQEWDMT